MPTSGTINSTMTAQQLVTAAMEELGVISSGEQPTAEEGETGLARLNWMLKSWQADGVNLWREEEGEVEFLAGEQSVTLDPNVDDVLEARLVQSSTYERPLQRVEIGEYRAYPNKAQQGWPAVFYLNKQRSSTSLTLWPVPSEDVTIRYTYARIIEDVTDLQQEVDVPQEWLEAVWVNLAARLITIFGVTRIDPTAAAEVKERAIILYDKMLTQDRPASVFMGSAYGGYF